jgi:GDPmannose 4,6-dehydratase
MTNNKTALICGISGQDGALLARFLLGKGYRVFGTSRDAQGQSFKNLARLDITDQIDIISMISQDFRSVLMALNKSEADEVYFLSGQSSVGLSFDEPAETIESIMRGTLNMLEACRMLRPEIRQYYAGSIECYGDTNGVAVNEATAFSPRSPYGVAKASAVWLVNNYREAYGLHACNGILSNHESALRPTRFVTQKIIQAAKKISEESKGHLELGRLDVYRDWGWAAEFVEAMWLTLQQDNPDNYLISTGQTRSLEEFVQVAFSLVGLDWREHVTTSKLYYRPSDIMQSYTDPTKAQKKLGWKAETLMEGVVQRMLLEDIT